MSYLLICTLVLSFCLPLVHVRTYVRLYVCTHSAVCVRMCVCVCACVRACVGMCMCASLVLVLVVFLKTTFSVWNSCVYAITTLMNAIGLMDCYL